MTAREKYLPDYVGLDPMVQTGFNYWNDSLSLDSGAEPLIFYISNRGEYNIVIAERRDRTGARRRTEWFFDVFEAKPLSRRNNEEVQEYFSRLRSVTTRKNRVAGRDLEMRVVQATAEIDIFQENSDNTDWY